MFFDNYPEFIEQDLRSKRPYMVINSETLTKRLEVILPKELSQNKTVLDLGSALGAMGHLALTNGATKYLGVEIQKHYFDRSKELLEKYHPEGPWNFVRTMEEVEGQYDVVVAAGFIHGFFDVFDVLKKVCSFSKEFVVIETNEPKDNNFATITFDEGKMVNNNGQAEKYFEYTGIKTVPSKPAIDLIMKTNGFNFVKRVFPEPFSRDYDAFNNKTAISSNINRFILVYKKSTPMKTLETIIANDNMEV